MQIGVSTGFADRLGIDVYSALDIVSSTPIKIVELWTVFYGKKLHFNWKDKTEIQKIKHLLTTLGITVYSIHAPFSYEYDISSPEIEKQKKVIEDIKEIFFVAEEFNAKVVVVHPATKPDTSRRHLSSQEYFERLTAAKYAINEFVEFIIKNRLNIKIALENQLPHIMFSYPNELLDLITSTNPDIVGICFDTGHAELFNEKNILYNMMEQMKHHIISLHISDTDNKTDNHLVLGEGNIKWHRVYEILHSVNYQNPFMLEILTPINGKDIKESLIEAYKRAKILLEDW